MPFTITAAQELDIPIVMFFTISACSFMCNMHIPALKDKGITPLKGMYNKSYPKPFLSLVLILLVNIVAHHLGVDIHPQIVDVPQMLFRIYVYISTI
jgi:hypothetical protein